MQIEGDPDRGATEEGVEGTTEGPDRDLEAEALTGGGEVLLEAGLAEEGTN